MLLRHMRLVQLRLHLRRVGTGGAPLVPLGEVVDNRRVNVILHFLLFVNLHIAFIAFLDVRRLLLLDIACSLHLGVSLNPISLGFHLALEKFVPKFT